MKYTFKNYQCGELCPSNSLSLQLPDDFEYEADLNFLLDDLANQGWFLASINNKTVHSSCSCRSPITEPNQTLCNTCKANKHQLNLNFN